MIELAAFLGLLALVYLWPAPKHFRPTIYVSAEPILGADLIKALNLGRKAKTPARFWVGLSKGITK